MIDSSILSSNHFFVKDIAMLETLIISQDTKIRTLKFERRFILGALHTHEIHPMAKRFREETTDSEDWVRQEFAFCNLIFIIYIYI